MAATNERTLEGALAQIEKRERSARQRAVVYSIIPIAMGALILGYSAYRIQAESTQVRELEAQIGRNQALLKDSETQVRKSREEAEGVRRQLANSRAAVSYVTQGINLFHQRRYVGAVSQYDRALQLDPENPYVHNLKGYALFKARRLSESVEALRKAVKIDGQYAWGYFDLARAYCAAAEFENAKQAAQKAIELRPELEQIMKADGEFMRLCRKIVTG
jgi:tetratricopeptide (TPR) repeat protein